MVEQDEAGVASLRVYQMSEQNATTEALMPTQNVGAFTFIDTQCSLVY